MKVVFTDSLIVIEIQTTFHENTSLNECLNQITAIRIPS